MNLLITGPAGSGKGTLSNKIIEAYGLPHISTGDMLREEIKANTDLGMKAKVYMDEGKLVPDNVVIGMVEHRLSQPDCQKGYLMDGFPRTLAQAEALDELAKRLGKPVQMVINLEVPFEELATRITGRRICKQCGAIYHVKNHPPKVEGVCDQCGARLVQRSDDTVEQLKVRMEEYQKNTAPAIEHYRKMGLVADIDAARGVDAIWQTIQQVLQQHQGS